MKNYLFVGDTHGDLDFLQNAAEYAALNGAEIIQVGDWGFVWPSVRVAGGVVHQVDALQRILEHAGEMHGQPPVTMRFIDGNHDYHPWLRAHTNMFSLADALLPGGGHHLNQCPNVIYQPRGSMIIDEDGTTFLFCGGAPSIDWMSRVEGWSVWLEQEVISEDEFEHALNVLERIDVLVTHDAPMFPPGYGPKGDPTFRAKGARSMQMIKELVNYHLPELLVHGHWHTRYSTTMCGDAPTDVTHVEGLDCNYALLEDATMLWSRA